MTNLQVELKHFNHQFAFAFALLLTMCFLRAQRAWMTLTGSRLWVLAHLGELCLLNIKEQTSSTP